MSSKPIQSVFFQSNIAKRANKGISKEDIEMVVKQADVPAEKAEAGLKKNEGDIAATILELKGEE